MKKSAVPICPPVEQRLFRVRDAARYLGVATWFVRTMVWRREIPVVKFGNKFLFDKCDLDAYVEKHKKVA